MAIVDPDAAFDCEYADTGEPQAPVRLRVALVDDNVEFVDRVAELLGAAFDVVGRFYDGESALRAMPSLKPNAIVMDVSMGEMSGIELAQRLLKQNRWGARIVFLSVHEEPEFVSVALAAGAAGYVFKTRLGADLIPAINSACSGNLFVSSKFY